MRILLVGGGSGGHVTPLKAITDELPNQSTHKIDVVTNRDFAPQTRQLFSDNSSVRVHAIFAGKLRRYKSKSFLWHFLHLPTLFYNVRDILFLFFGLIQSIYLIIRLQPDVVFCKGGFVCIPVGVTAHLFGKRLIIHDSDTRPGLTNRVLSRWASTIATGMPAEFYPYSPSKMRYIGMPVDRAYRPQTVKEQLNQKQQLGFTSAQPILLVTGGGNGAESLNQKISDGVGELLSSGWGIIHVAGQGKSQKLLKQREELPEKQQKNWRIEEFVAMVPRILAADVIISRTSASTLQECANSQKVVIGVPSPHLDDQIKNADYFASHDAIIYIDETQTTAHELVGAVTKIYASKSEAQRVAKNLYKSFAKPLAAQELAKIIISGH